MSNYRLMDKAKLECRKRQYPSGTRIELICMDDPYTKLTAGDKGTIIDVDPLGDLEVDWDTGSTLKLIIGVDQFRIL